jgi:parvulin-like peptidyl-prolyl isomerase
MTPAKSKPARLLTILPLILLLSSCQSIPGFKNSGSNHSGSVKVSGKEESTANDPAKTAVSDDQSGIIVATYSEGYSDAKITLKDAATELNKLIIKNNKLKGLTFDRLSSAQKEIIIREIVLKEMAYKEAKKRKLDKEQDYQEALKLFKTELLQQKLFITIAAEARAEKNVQKNYDELVEKLKDKKDLRISYIAVKTEKEAAIIYQFLLKSPNSFASQARRKSLDKEIAKKGGDLGFVMEDALPAEVAKQAKSLAKGQIAKPIQTSGKWPGKWLIVKLEDERPAQIIPFKKAKDALAQNLAKKAMEDFVSQSLKKAKISILVK